MKTVLLGFLSLVLLALIPASGNLPLVLGWLMCFLTAVLLFWRALFNVLFGGTNDSAGD